MHHSLITPIYVSLADLLVISSLLSCSCFTGPPLSANLSRASPFNSHCRAVLSERDAFERQKKNGSREETQPLRASSHNPTSPFNLPSYPSVFPVAVQTSLRWPHSHARHSEVLSPCGWCGTGSLVNHRSLTMWHGSLEHQAGSLPPPELPLPWSRGMHSSRHSEVTRTPHHNPPSSFSPSPQMHHGQECLMWGWQSLASLHPPQTGWHQLSVYNVESLGSVTRGM